MRRLVPFTFAILGTFIIIGVTRMDYTDPRDTCVRQGGHVVYEKAHKGRLVMRCAEAFIDGGTR